MPPRYYTADGFVPLNNFSYNSFDGSITFNCDHLTNDAIKEILGITNNTNFLLLR